MTDSTPTPESVTIEEAIERWLQKRQTDSTDRTIRGYRSRMSQFLKYCTEHSIETVADLDAWTIDEYQLDVRNRGYAPTTIKGRLNTVRLWIEYIEILGLADDGLSEAIDIPELSQAEETDERRLKSSTALSSLERLRASREHYGTSMHAALEIFWHVGARIGGVHAIDLDDLDTEDQSLQFVHRPSTDTPLKNKNSGERFVGLSDETIEVIRFYIARERDDKRDCNGRAPLFATRQGRASLSSLRAWSYQATQPCLWTECPHGRRRSTCAMTQRNHASKCPSSRSPHAVRTGSITWQLNSGYPIELVAKRANASIPVIKQYYDQATAREEFERRRHEPETNLDIQTNHDQ